MSLLARPIIRMPDFCEGEWLNSTPLTRGGLRGRVLLIDFWDYACVNCIRTLPYLVEWHKRYAHKGLTLVGIHTPEFKFAQHRTQVEKAIDEFGLPYPVLLDNEYGNWEQFANKAWPTKYLVDANGYIRYERRGEGGYRETEQAIQQLLKNRDPQVRLPKLMAPLRQEDQPGAVCYRTTPELHAGYRSGLFGGALGNPEGYHPAGPMVYALPRPDERQEGRFYAAGIWQARPEAFSFAGHERGRIVLPYSAAGINAVLSPSGDEVELRLALRPTENEPLIQLKLDGRALTHPNAGADVFFTQDGRSLVRVTRPRMVELVRHPDYESHELELTFYAKGLSLYAFSFTSCVAPPNTPDTTRVDML